MRTGPDGSVWRASDETLDRPVSVRVLPPGHRHIAEVVDAARRASLVEDPRLVRVLNVGDVGGAAYIVAEHLVGQVLEELLTRGPLPADQARAIIGEAAEALDRASSRGLHHLRLTPASIVIPPSGVTGGPVKILGTAVDAALTGAERSGDPAAAERADVLGLVNVLYAALTGLWPGAVETALGAAPRVGGQPVPPGDLVAGVPNDLDTLVTVTLGPHDDGPRTPGDLAAQLAPWAGGPARAQTRLQSVPASAPPEVVAESAPQEALVGTSRFTSSPAASVYRSTPLASANAPASPSTSGGRTPADEWSLLGAAQPAASGIPASPAATSPVPPSPPQPAATPPGDDAVPLGPFIPPAPISRPSRDQAQFVIVVVVGLVVLGLVLAVLGLIGMGKPAPLVGSGPLIPSASAPRPSAGTTSSPAGGSNASASPSGSVTPPAGAGEPATITGIEAIDPQGDGQEGGGSAPKAIDGDPGTPWRSDRYASADFGGLKHGLGLYLRLSEGVVSTVTVTMGGTGGVVELRTTTSPGLDGSTVVASATVRNGQAVLTPAQPVTASALLLWFTSLPQQDNGEYRASVSEISVS